MVRERAIILIEWPERAGSWVPPLDRHLRLSYDSDPSRRVVEQST
jgi:tRNA A37 threonylcarbamoyladenosine biosynthesis protein TsaE